MTHAGTITIGVAIDGENLGAKVTAAVRRGVAPMLAEMQAGLAKTNKSLTGLDTTGIKGVTAEAGKASRATQGMADAARDATKAQSQQKTTVDNLAAATTKLGQAQRDFTTAVELYGKKSPQAEAAYRRLTSAQSKHSGELIRAASESRISTASQIADYQRLARAAEESAARQAAAARAAGIGGGGGGGGGGGPPGGRHAGGFMRGGQGRYGFLTSPVGLNAGALAIGSLPAAATVVTNLTGAVQQLAQAGLVLPGVFAGVASSVGVAALGFQGVGDAITTMWEAAASGDPKDLEKAQEALKGITPEAAAVVTQIGKLRPELMGLRDLAQSNIFRGVDTDLAAFADKTIPTARKGIDGISQSWNASIREMLRVGGLDSTQSFLDRIFGNTAEAQTRANAAIEPLIHGLGTLTAEGTDFLPRLADGLTGVTTRFDNFITKAAEDGRLDKWIDQGITGVGQLGETFLNIGKIITSITQAAGGDGGLLKMLDDGSTKLAAFLASAEGQENLTGFFREGREQLAQWGDVLGEIGPILLQVYDASKVWADILLAVLPRILDLLNAIPGGLEAVLIGFLAYKTLSPFQGLLGGLTNLNTQITTVGRNADGLKGKLAGAFGAGGAGRNAAGIIGPGLLFAGATGNGAEGPSGLDVAATIGGGAALGFSVGGPWGALIGGFAGALTTMTQTILAANDRLNALKTEAERPSLAVNVPANIAPTTGVIAPVTPPPIADLTPTITTGPGRGVFAIPGTPGPSVLDPAAISADALRKSLSDTRVEIGNTLKDLGVLADQVHALPEGFIEIDSNDKQVKAALEALGLKVTDLPTGKLLIRVTYTDARGNEVNPANIGLGGTVGVSGPPLGNAGGRWGSASGGVLPGYSPGVDNMLWPLSGGEGIIIPEAMRALGPEWLYNLNSQFRSGLSRRGYADGGVHLGTGLPPNPMPGGDPVVGLLTQIRDLLAGKGGGPIADTAMSTGTIADGVTTAGALTRQRDPAREMAAAAISALGGDPEKFLGPDPATFRQAASAALGPGGLGAPNTSAITSALAAFATSGDLSGVTGFGLDAADPVIKAIVSARNKKKGGLDDTAIADLVTQVIGGGGFTGTLDSSNSTLITALETFRNKLAKGTAGTSQALPVTVANVDAIGGTKNFPDAGLVPAAAALNDVIGQLFPSITEIGGFRQDPHPDHPSGRALDIMIPGGDTSGGRNPQGKLLGDQIFNWLLSTGIIDPQGSLWQTNTGGNHFNHIHARIAEGMENAGVGGLTGLSATAPGLPGADIATAGSPVPVWIVGQGPMPSALPGQMFDMFGKPIAGAGIDAAGQAAAGVASDIINAAGGVPLPGLDPATLNRPGASDRDLLTERNPLALAGLAGFTVPDFTRQGQPGGPAMRNDEAFTADGRLLSDTDSLLQRTFTDKEAADEARFQQTLAVLNEVKERLSKQALEPIVSAAVTEGFTALKDTTFNQMGSALGQTAAPPIADAVGSAVRSAAATSGGPNTGAGGLVAGAGDLLGGALFATGGPVYGGTPGVDSVPILAQQGEWVLNTDDVARLGGMAGAAKFVGALRGGGIRGFASGGGVIGNATVGADFFGVSQVPIIGAIVNLLVQVLLKVIGVEIEVRDTLDEMSKEVRAFRGDFQRFDARGLLINDTSGLLDRSQSSEQTVADERIRILKIVLEALIKYIIEKVIVPITKAVANAAIQAGASAAGAAINTQAPGAGGIVSSLISSAGQAGVEIAAEVGTDFALALSSTLIDLVGEGLQTLLPDLMTTIFGGNILAGLFDPITALFGGLLGGPIGVLSSLLAVVSDPLGGFFDDGGVAAGVGLMPKATIRPERVLSPQQTESFDRLVAALTAGDLRTGSSSRSYHVQAQINMPHGDPVAVRDSLLELMDA